MNILYTSDGEQTGHMTLDALIKNIDDYNTRCFHGDAVDIRHITEELQSRGWCEGFNDFGHFLVLNLDKLPLDYRIEQKR